MKSVSLRTLWAVSLIVLFFSMSAHAEKARPRNPAQEKGAQADSGQSGEKSEKIDIDKLRNKYWAQGKDGDLAIIQNRQYSKAHRLELSLIGGFVSTDPFLSVRALGGSLSYYIKETWAIEAVGWKSFVSNSSANDSLQQVLGANVLLNRPQWFAGLGVWYIPIYGKLSLFENAILHFDLGLTAGVGFTGTDSGTDFTPYLGIGQRLYLTKSLSLKFEYKIMRYNEQVPKNVNPGSGISGTADRTNLSEAILLGVGFLF